MKLYISWTWDAIGALASLIAAIVVPVSLGFLWWQIREMRKTTYAQAFATALEHLQNEEIRTARRVVFGLRNKPLDEWTEAERLQAERVCQSYDVVGIMVNSGMLPEDLIAKEWRNSLVRSWEVLQPLVQRYREQRSDSDFWNDFEWLANEATRQKV